VGGVICSVTEPLLGMTMRNILTLMLVVLTRSTSTAADPWTQYGGPTGDFRIPAIAAANTVQKEWKRDLPAGRCGVVSDGTRLFTMYSRPVEGTKSTVDEYVIAMKASTGETLWEEANRVTLLEKQEAFGGAQVQPQATPVVSDGRVLSVGITGLVSARDTATGKLAWTCDLVKDYKAKPVQYGFTASPVCAGGNFIVPTGGQHAAIALVPATGKLVWASAAAEPAYGTPVLLRIGKAECLVLQTRDALLGLDIATGATLWTLPTPKLGLTNVPTPMVLPEGKIVVSGQGWNGTRLLQLSVAEKTWMVKEVWQQTKAQYFYTNWTIHGFVVIGFTGNSSKRLTALRLKDGSIVSQDQGHTDCNVLALGDELLVLRGDGLLSIGKVDGDTFEASRKAQPLTGRCWVAPTVFGSSVVLRTPTQLARVNLDTMKADFQAPKDAGVSALDAAFGTKPKK
jgi:outer membrane protein assembly factor BamB